MTLLSSQVAAVAPDSPYLDLNVPPAELRPSATLTIGQCFHWRVIEPNDNPARSTLPTSAWGTHDSTEWVGILRISNSNHSDAHSIVVSLQETPDTTLYRVLHAPPLVTTTNNVERILHDYFQLDTPLGPLYREWSQADSIRLAKIAECIPGVRIVNQDPWECLVSFLCSSNNNIPRITKMLKAIRETYGTPLVTIGEETLYSFPSCEELRNRATEQDLRDIGMGYRAKYLIQTMETLAELGGEAYLHALRETRDANVVQEALMQFSGVGRKVADCVALFSLRQGDAIPIDVHVWNIARRDYDKEGVLVDVKSMTPTIYKQTASLFQSRFKRYAGWAHTLLFVAELPSFRAVLPQNVIDEMEKFREIEQKKKTAAREAKRAEKRHLT
jgi:N-glycosylase/DNA lyase